MGRLTRFLSGVAMACVLGCAVNDAFAQSTPAWTQREADLRMALQHPDTAKVRALVDAGANVNARDDLGGTALHVAVNFRGDLDVVRLLIDRGANVNAPDTDGDTPLLRAMRHAHYRHSDPQRLRAVVELLLSRGAVAKIAGKDTALPVRAAMDPLNLPVLRLLLKHGAAMPDSGLDWALSNDQVELVKELLARPAPAMLAFKDVHGGSMLHRAAESSRMVFAMEWLVRHGADIHAADADGTTPFGRAAFHGNLPAMEYLHRLKAGSAQANGQGQTPLHLAAYGARHAVLEWLVRRGADLKAKDSRGRTALDLAIDTHTFAFLDEGRKERLVVLLGGTPADVLRGRFAGARLHEATHARDLGEVKRLLEAGADPNVKNESGHTPLYWAIAWSSGLPASPAERAFGQALLPLLIRHGADPDMRMGDGSTQRTYTQYARDLRIGEMLDNSRRRLAPR